LRRFVHYFAGCRKDVPRHRQQPSLSRYMVFSCLLFISQINLGLRTVGSYNPPIVGAGYWISRYFLLKVPSLSGDEVQVVANISQRGLDLSLAWLPSFAFAPHRVGTLLATKIPWRDSIRFHEGHLSIKFHPLGMKWCSNLFSFQLRSRAFATPCSSSDAPKCIALIGPRRIDHVFVTFRGSSNRQCSATKVVLRLHSLCQEISPYMSIFFQCPAKTRLLQDPISIRHSGRSDQVIIWMCPYLWHAERVLSQFRCSIETPSASFSFAPGRTFNVKNVKRVFII
jgi:hypothetical protein